MTRVPANTLRYWRHKGIGPKSGKVGPRRIRYREQDVLDWIETQFEGKTDQIDGAHSA